MKEIINEECPTNIS